jgi:hypothetical protein
LAYFGTYSFYILAFALIFRYHVFAFGNECIPQMFFVGAIPYTPQKSNEKDPVEVLDLF